MAAKVPFGDLLVLISVCESCRYELVVIGLTWTSIVCGDQKHNERFDRLASI